jgi:hypothetical protein
MIRHPGFCSRIPHAIVLARSERLLLFTVREDERCSVRDLVIRAAVREIIMHSYQELERELARLLTGCFIQSGPTGGFVRVKPLRNRSQHSLL